MSGFIREVRRTARSLARSPLFTVISVVTLAVAIGANSAIFSVVNGVLLRPLPYPESDRLVVVGHTAPIAGFPEVPQATGTYVLYRDEAATLDGLTMFWDGSVNLTGTGEPEQLSAAGVTGTFFDVLRTPPALGRGFTEEELLPDGEAVVILSHGLWQRRYGGAQNIIGQTMLIDGESRRIVGVTPAGFDTPYDSDIEIWLPLVIDPEELTTGSYSFAGIGRLKEGVSVEAAYADIRRLTLQLPERYPGDLITHEMMAQSGWDARVVTLISDVTDDVNRALWILLGTVAVVLLIACANVANLFLVRAEGRHKEIAIRSALGAERGALARGFLRESTVLAMAGGALGLLLAFGGIKMLVALGPDSIPRLEAIQVDGGVLLFTLGVSVAAGLLFGLAPLLRHTRPDIAGALKEGFRGTTSGRGRVRARTILVFGQVALAFLLMVGSGLLVKSFWHLKNVDPGFEAENLLTLRLSLPETPYDDTEMAVGFYQTLVDRVSEIPGIQMAGTASKIPLRGAGENHNGILIEDRPVEPGAMPHVALSIMVGHGYFETMGIQLLEGRLVERSDITAGTGAVIVSRAFAEHYWPGESAVGKQVWQGIADDMEEDEDFAWRPVVGVVEDVRDLGLETEIRPVVYYALAGPGNGYRNSMSLVVRTSAAPSSLAPPVRDLVWAIDPNVPITGIETMKSVLRDATSRAAFTMLMLGIAAGVALLLGAVGLYGVISYGVTQRRQEIGVRMALGAPAGRVRGMVVRQGAIVAGVGLAVGFTAALGLTRLMEALLFEVSPTDPPTFGLVVALLFGVSIIASWIPARRAASVDPAIALRAE
jgi:predicted permease